MPTLFVTEAHTQIRPRGDLLTYFWKGLSLPWMFGKSWLRLCSELLAFKSYSINFSPSKIHQSGTTFCPQASIFQKIAELAIFSIFYELLFSQNVSARNVVKWDFSLIFKHHVLDVFAWPPIHSRFSSNLTMTHVTWRFSGCKKTWERRKSLSVLFT